MLLTSGDVISFARWILAHGSLIPQLSIATNFTPLSNALPAYIAGGCPSLRKLTLDVPSYDSAAFMLMAPRLEHLTLNLSGYQDDRVSLEDVEFPVLHALCIDRCRSKQVLLPGRLQQLEHLYVSHCSLQGSLPVMPRVRALELPNCVIELETVASLTTLTTLTKLDLRGNGMTYAPDELEHLVHLEDLDLSHNRLVNYDERDAIFEDTLVSIEGLTALRSLNISHNFLDTMGMEPLANLTCTRLERLDVSCNPCTDIPDGGYLQNLTLLTTSFIPSCLGRMTRVNEIRLHGHCQHHLPYEDPWPDVSHVTVPPSLDTLCIDEDDHVAVRLVHDMFELVKKTPRLCTRINA
jgi:Leucine-rich repeat (LRR) protein